jgi:hypothetical protein
MNKSEDNGATYTNDRLDGSRGSTIVAKGLREEAAQAGGHLGRKNWRRLIWAWLLVSMEELLIE